MKKEKSGLKKDILIFIEMFGFIGWCLFFEFIVFGYLPTCN